MKIYKADPNKYFTTTVTVGEPKVHDVIFERESQEFIDAYLADLEES